ncbi:hypothetical protein [Chondromyces crocatus]|uniref:Uncharacterized protein n=1 Tax=Chondromyces crocatus TaxID=52 RepID=A0A0K1EAN4_CHOCO|nr:hypothetical protein [Chondromyces crocatus]AKT37919.1 uncharacterized protein CMC5_020620 [Chondromyces crocatus]
MSMRHLVSCVALVTGLGLLHAVGGCAVVVGADFGDRTLGEGSDGVDPPDGTPSCDAPCPGAPSRALWFGNKATQDEVRVTVGPSGEVYVALDASGQMAYGDTTLGETNRRQTHLFQLDTSLEHQWAIGIGGGIDHRLADMALHPTDGIVLAGNFKWDVDIGGKVISSGDWVYWEGFVARVDASGNPIWAVPLSGAGESVAHSVAVAPDGTIVLVGWFRGRLDAGAGLDSSDARRLFVVKFGQDGDVRWSKRFSVSPSHSVGVDVGPEGEIAIAGTFNGSFDIDDDEQPPLDSMADPNGYVFVLDPEGNFRWAQTQRSNSVVFPIDVLVESDERVLVTGYFLGKDVPFGDAAHPLTLTAKGQDAFLAAYDLEDGTPQWARAYGGEADDIGFRLESDGAGHVLWCGAHRSSMDLTEDGGPRLEQGEGREAFVFKFTPSSDDGPGPLRWASSIGGPGDQSALDVAGGPGTPIYAVGPTNHPFTLKGTDAAISVEDNGWDVWLVSFVP